MRAEGEDGANNLLNGEKARSFSSLISCALPLEGSGSNDLIVNHCPDKGPIPRVPPKGGEQGGISDRASHVRTRRPRSQQEPGLGPKPWASRGQIHKR